MLYSIQAPQKNRDLEWLFPPELWHLPLTAHDNDVIVNNGRTVITKAELSGKQHIVSKAQDSFDSLLTVLANREFRVEDVRPFTNALWAVAYVIWPSPLDVGTKLSIVDLFTNKVRRVIESNFPAALSEANHLIDMILTQLDDQPIDGVKVKEIDQLYCVFTASVHKDASLRKRLETQLHGNYWSYAQSALGSISFSGQSALGSISFTATMLWQCCHCNN